MIVNPGLGTCAGATHLYFPAQVYFCVAVLKHLQPGILKATQHQNLLVFLKVQQEKKGTECTDDGEGERERIEELANLS